MLLCIPNLLTKEQVAACRAKLETADWQDGRLTAGSVAIHVKANLQLPQTSPVAQELGDLILDALAKHPLFLSAALPNKIFPPMFNRYEGGGHYGTHVDNAIRYVPGTAVKVRTDVSTTVFFSEAEDYDGGELVIEDAFGAQEVKLSAGDAVVYPATSLHQVRPVTRGARYAAFFWTQSMVRDDTQRALLYDLDQSVQALTAELGSDHAQVRQLSWIYHNLLRQWAET